ncbi:PTS lactose/cellobiose transporter subunit IIA [Tatumella citrea]|uniref:Molecular chaperone TorD n=1 Tax=Tatumella citrea TaxID=53336 RepID=A0A1Y0L614_TATCI|nr:PTS lactose/cellobiose transporter subunit IIA [Tatumella citrea]ARU93098.1 molecular chaperone TorD [Tatumella citrea]ARU97136.1 molecular chaperone TorD [Tatumella citrea]
MDINEEMMINLILCAGESKSYAMEAIQAARISQWETAADCLQKSTLSARQCHNSQTQLIGLDEGCGKIPVSLIMVHAQDHIMNAMLCREMAEEIVALYQKFNSLTSLRKEAE